MGRLTTTITNYRLPFTIWFVKITTEQAERLESLKAGTIAALFVSFAFLSTTAINHLLLATNFMTLSSLQTELLNWQWVVSGAIAAFCGLLFGVTYRYAIRSDDNLQLKTGVVLAFGLVRGLTQLEIGANASGSILPFVVMAGESILWFAIAAIALNWAIQQGWVKPFNSN
jgi:hypothetical protein